MEQAELKDRLKIKKVAFTELIGEGENLRKRWEAQFANHLSHSQKKKIYLDSFLWHIFSYEKLKCAEGEQATKAFNEAVKQECYVFYQHVDDALFIQDSSKLEDTDFITENKAYLSDIYVTDKDFTWTYVKTHEACCGPYFYKISEAY
ncbi:DUF4275 family protein [Priestia megaterium]|nr:DUF4275 family protein [Priestia megaterium]